MCQVYKKNRIENYLSLQFLIKKIREVVLRFVCERADNGGCDKGAFKFNDGRLYCVVENKGPE